MPGICDSVREEEEEERFFDSKAAVTHFAEGEVKRFRDLLFIGKSTWRGLKVNLNPKDL